MTALLPSATPSGRSLYARLQVIYTYNAALALQSAKSYVLKLLDISYCSGSKMASRQIWKCEKKVRLSKEVLTLTDLFFILSTLTACIFGTTGSLET